MAPPSRACTVRCEMDDTDEESYVTIGEPLELIDEDVPVPRKAPQVEDETVRDEKGRQRFHGAFTGGFSAGYFNTVGSKQGWVPSTFKSSREKQDEKFRQKPEDFMDDEDLGDFGIAPRQVTTRDIFGAGGKKRKAHEEVDRIIPGAPPLKDLVVPAKLPIGIQLLRKMGWKEGQGIGPRVKKKSKKKGSTVKKMYGCSLPDASSESEESEDEYATQYTFAPKDTCPFSFKAKDNLHGLGYKGITPTSVLGGHINLFEAPQEAAVRGTKGKAGIRGKAFGIGALEDEDPEEDIYATDSWSRYDRVLGGEEEGKGAHSWTAPRKSRFSPMEVDSTAHIAKILEGFTLSSKSGKGKKVFPPPTLPKHFRPVHINVKHQKFLLPQVQQLASTSSSAAAAAAKVSKHDAKTREALLDDEAKAGSVFELMTPESKARFEAAKQQISAGEQPVGGSTQRPEQTSTTPKSSSASSTAAAGGVSTESKSVDTSAAVPESLPRWQQALLKTGAPVFKPFAKFPEKQTRYEKYQEATKQGKTYDDIDSSGLTEWERDHEKEEFARAAHMYKPLSNLMASRFTRGKYDEDDKVDVPAETGSGLSEQGKAAEMGMYGRLTRETLDWYPHKNLCKRFNVPEPYPGSGITGIPKLRKDKFSVFNFLTVPSDQESRAEATSKEDSAPPKAIEFTSTTAASSTKPQFNFTWIKKDSKVESAAGADFQKGAGSEDNEEEEKRPPMDLFKAIFDSDSSSSSSEEEEEKEKEEEKKNEPQPSSSAIPENTRTHTMRAAIPGKILFSSKRQTKDTDSKTSSSAIPGSSHTHTMGAAVPGKIVFSSTKQRRDRDSETLPSDGLGSNTSTSSVRNDASIATEVKDEPDDSTFAVEPLEVRLSPPVEEKSKNNVEMEMEEEDESMLYMPQLPPSAVSSSGHAPTPPSPPGGNSRNSMEPTPGSSSRRKHSKHSKHKHKHKKLKHKKKKSKSKKKKHKSHSHKSKKKKKRSTASSEEDSSSSDDESEDSDEEDENNKEEPTAAQLLHKIKSLPGGSRRLAAADFM